MAYLTLLLKDAEDQVLDEIIIYINESHPLARSILDAVPFKAKPEFWKEEIYFKTPVKGEKGLLTSEVIPGEVAYWPPGSALCLFYGLSQPYGKVTTLGYIVGKLSDVRRIVLEYEDEVESIEVREVEDKREFVEVLSKLRAEGYLSAVKTTEERTIAAATIRDGMVIGFEAYVEPYAVIIETQDLLSYDYHDALSYLISLKVRKYIRDKHPTVRVDVSEEGGLCLSMAVKGLDDIPKACNMLAEAYISALKYIEEAFR